jgi:hypothetical protein
MGEGPYEEGFRSGAGLSRVVAVDLALSLEGRDRL